jgi:Zn-dependent peptidase ImmA (M78 family)
MKNDIPNLRKLVGHELGHLALHLDELLTKTGHTLGTKAIQDPVKESDADKFAEELIRLRDEHLMKRFSAP